MTSLYDAKVMKCSEEGTIELAFEGTVEGLAEYDTWSTVYSPNVLLMPEFPKLDINYTGSLEAGLKGNHFDTTFADKRGGDESPEGSDSEEDNDEPVSVEARISSVREQCNEFELRLLEAVVKPGDIHVTFSDIHVDPKTVRTLRTLTSLALVNPMAFSYGILSKEKVLGVMLHGPPGTGKSLLAKAVAKESVACMLEVSGADFRSKWIGEDEKLVRAVFSLARKLDPCVIFIDEADAVFRKRSADDSEYRRDMLSQFLQEWDGVSSSSKGGFVMVATNRPEDLDAAVLRRLPRRIYVGLPSDEDREAILRIHLKEEKLGDDVDLEDIARQASEFTGSDLKNLCVVAAMASVYEAHSEMLEGFGGQSWKKGRRRRARLPAGRVIYARHFQQALSEIGAAMEAPGISKIREFGRLYKEKI